MDFSANLRIAAKILAGVATSGTNWCSYNFRIMATTTRQLTRALPPFDQPEPSPSTG